MCVCVGREREKDKKRGKTVSLLLKEVLQVERNGIQLNPERNKMKESMMTV